MGQTYDARYYATMYRDYARQNPRRKLAHYRTLVERHAPAGARRVHDVGYAFGLFLGEIGARWERTGSDVSEYAIDAARARFPDVSFHAGDADHVPPEPFDVVTAFDVIEHIADLERAGDALRAQLQPDGIFVFVVPVYDGPLGALVRRLDRDPTHVHKWPRSQWLAWARRRFDVVEWEGIVRGWLPGGFYVHFPTRALRQIAPAVAVICRRHDP